MLLPGMTAGAGAGSFISLNQGGKGGQPVMKRMHPAYVLTQLPRFFWLLILPLVRRMIEWQETGFVKKLPLLIAVVLIFAAAFLRWKTQRWAIQGKTLLLFKRVAFPQAISYSINPHCGSARKPRPNAAPFRRTADSN